MKASKGVHLVVPRSAIDGADVEGAGGTRSGLILDADQRAVRHPVGEYWILGTTDTPWRLDRDHPAASSADIAYLLDQVNRARPAGDHRPDPGVYAGLRPLLAGSPTRRAGSREHAVVTPVPGSSSSPAASTRPTG